MYKCILLLCGNNTIMKTLKTIISTIIILIISTFVLISIIFVFRQLRKNKSFVLVSFLCPCSYLQCLLALHRSPHTTICVKITYMLNRYQFKRKVKLGRRKNVFVLSYWFLSKSFKQIEKEIYEHTVRDNLECLNEIICVSRSICVRLKLI